MEKRAFTPTEKKYRLFRAWSAGHPIWCTWQVTYRCNFRCKFCNYWTTGISGKDEPPASAYARGAQKLARMGSLLISLGGGEPLIRTDIVEIVEAIGRYHFPFITTNGWFVTPQLATDLMKAGLWGISISIDYATAERHDARRGMIGAWEQAWRAVEMLQQARVFKWQRVNVLTVLMDDNFDELEDILEMAREREAYFMVQPYATVKTGSSRFAHNNGRVSLKLLQMRRRASNFLSNPRYLSQFDQFLTNGIANCKAGKVLFNIDEKGNVAICVEHRNNPVGNLLSDNLTDIEKRLHRAARNNTCRQCWYNCRGEIESLYHPIGLIHSLPTLLFDRGKAPVK